MISERPLEVEAENYVEDIDKAVSIKSLPPWMEFDTIYYFSVDDESDDSEAKSSIKV